jgi:hypothetical protein
MNNLTIAKGETAAALGHVVGVGLVARPCYGAQPEIPGSLGAAVAKAAANRDGYGMPQRLLRHLRWSPAYTMSAFVGLLTFGAYGSLNDAWTNPALIGVSIYMFLSIPLYSKFSNRVESVIAQRTKLETCGRLGRYVPQLLINLVLLWVFITGQVIDPAGLAGIGGFFATAAWITIVSQGGQYMANWLARRNLGNADSNVVFAVSFSAIVTALAVSGVMWIQPIYIAASLSFGAVIFGIGLITDTRQCASNAVVKVARLTRLIG